MKKLIIPLLFVFSLNALAEDTAKYLPKGEPAPFSGYLLSPEKADKVRLITIDLSLSKKTNDILTQQNTLLQTQVAQSQEHINNLNKTLVDSKDSAFLSKIGMFLLGATSATVIAWGVSRAVR